MIVISGGKGFIGSHLVKAFRGTQKVISIHSGANRIEKTGLIEIGFNHPELPNVLREAEVFIHAAGCVKGSETQLQQANIDATRRFAQTLPESIKSIIHLSSVNVYFSDLDPYGRSKQQSELIWQESAHLQKTIMLRCALVYGPGDQKNIYRLIALVQRWPILFMPEAGNFRPVYIQDLVSLIARLVELGTPCGGIWDVSGKEATTFYRLTQLVAAQLPTRPIILPLNRDVLASVQAVASRLRLKYLSNRFAMFNISRDYHNPEIWGAIQNQTTPLAAGVQTTVDAYLNDMTR